jgi:hypothetical protein
MSFKKAWQKVAIGGGAVACLGLSAIFGGASAFPGGPGGPGGAVAVQQHVMQTGVSLKHPTLASNSTDPVGTVIVLALDASGSMSDEEWRLQTRATAAAVTSELVQSSIRCKAGNNSIAIAVVEFDDTAKLRIPFVDLRPKSCSEEDVEFTTKVQMLGAEIANLKRAGSGSTGVGNMLEFTLGVFNNSPWIPTERRVLDVSGDGSNNTGKPVQQGRDALMAAGVTINGLAIVNDEPTLDEYYRNNLISNDIITSPDGRTTSIPGRVWAVARNMKHSNNSVVQLQAFGDEVKYALKSKISMELAGVYDLDKLNDIIEKRKFAELNGQNEDSIQEVPRLPQARQPSQPSLRSP